MGEENQVQDLGSTWNCVLSLLQSHGSDSVVGHLPGVYAKNIQISSVAPPSPIQIRQKERKQSKTTTKIHQQQSPVEYRWVCPAAVGGWRQGLQEVSSWACEEEKIICSFEGEYSPRLKATALEEGWELFYCWWESSGLNTNVGTFPWRSGKKTRRYWPSQSKDSP